MAISDTAVTRGTMADMSILTFDDTLTSILAGNCDFLRLELTAGRHTQQRFLRFRPIRELTDMRDFEAARVRDRIVEADDPDVIDIEAAVAADDVVSTLTDAIRVSAPANQIADPPKGYVAVPYPLDGLAREVLYGQTGETLQQVLPRHLPGAQDGWTWRVEQRISDDSRSLLVTLTPRNDRFEDHVATGEFSQDSALAVEPLAAVEILFEGGPLDGQVRETAQLQVDAAVSDADGGAVWFIYTIDRENNRGFLAGVGNEPPTT